MLFSASGVKASSSGGMFFVRLFVCWLVGWLVVCLFVCLVGWLFGWLVGGDCLCSCPLTEFTK